MGTSARSDSASTPGTDAGLTALFQGENDGMVRMATLLVDSGAIAGDLVHDAFITVRGRWRTIEQPGAYLRTTSLNACPTTLRRRGIEERFNQRTFDPGIDEMPNHLVETVVDDGPGIGHALLDGDIWQWLNSQGVTSSA